jgi:hypothetical protein
MTSMHVARPLTLTPVVWCGVVWCAGHVARDGPDGSARGAQAAGAAGRESVRGWPLLVLIWCGVCGYVQCLQLEAARRAAEEAAEARARDFEVMNALWVNVDLV